MNNYSFLFKYIIIGDASIILNLLQLVGVGKSCILMQFLQNKFKIDSQTTVGVQFGSRILDVGTQRIKLQIWDTAGQQIFKSITRSYYRGSIAAVLVYDVTNRQSFTNVSRWIEQTKNYANQKLSIILVGNKIDLEHRRVVSEKQGRQFAKQNGMLFRQCSAKDSKKTQDIFTDLAEEVLKKISDKVIDPRNQTMGVKIGTYRSTKLNQQDKGTCC